MRFEISLPGPSTGAVRAERPRRGALAILAGTFLVSCGSSSSGSPGAQDALQNRFGQTVLTFASSLTSSQVPAGEVIFPNTGISELLRVTLSPFAIKARVDLPEGWESAKFVPGPKLDYYILFQDSRTAILRNDGGLGVPEETLVGKVRGVLLDADRNHIALFDDLGGIALQSVEGAGTGLESVLAGPKVLGKAVVTGAFLPDGKLVVALEDGAYAIVDVAAGLKSGRIAAAQLKVSEKFAPTWLASVPGSGQLLLAANKEKIVVIDTAKGTVTTRLELKGRTWFASSLSMPHVIVSNPQDRNSRTVFVASGGAVAESQALLPDASGTIAASHLDVGRDDWWLFLDAGSGTERVLRYRFSDGLARYRSPDFPSDSKKAFFTPEALVVQDTRSRLGFLEKRPYGAGKPVEELKSYNLGPLLDL